MHDALQADREAQKSLHESVMARMQEIIAIANKRDNLCFKCIPVAGDGSCLPSSLSVGGLDKGIMTGTADEIRAKVVTHAENNPIVETTHTSNFTTVPVRETIHKHWCDSHKRSIDYCDGTFIDYFVNIFRVPVTVISRNIPVHISTDDNPMAYSEGIYVGLLEVDENHKDAHYFALQLVLPHVSDARGVKEPNEAGTHQSGTEVEPDSDTATRVRARVRVRVRVRLGLGSCMLYYCDSNLKSYLCSILRL